MKNQFDFTKKVDVLVNYYKSCEGIYCENSLMTLKTLIKSFRKNEIRYLNYAIHFRVQGKVLRNTRILYALINEKINGNDYVNFINEIITSDINLLGAYNFESMRTEIATFDNIYDNFDNLISIIVTNDLGKQITIDTTKKYHTKKNISVIVKHLMS